MARNLSRDSPGIAARLWGAVGNARVRPRETSGSADFAKSRNAGKSGGKSMNGRFRASFAQERI